MNQIKVVLAVAAASLSPVATLGLLTSDPAWWLDSCVLLGVLAATSIGIRLVRGGDSLARIGQLVVLLMWLGALSLRWQPEGALSQGFFGRIEALVSEGSRHIQMSQAPMPASPAALWLLLAFIGWLYIITELLVTTLEQPGWSIGVLSVPFLVTLLGPDLSPPWWSVASLAAGYALILYASTAAQTSPARGLTGDEGRRRRGSGRVSSAILVTALALVSALALGPVIPVTRWASLPRFTGPQAIELGDPSIDLSANLNRRGNPVLLTYTTDSGIGVRLRLIALPILDANGARLDTIQIRSGRLGAPPGHPGNATLRTRVQVQDFGSEYLPAPYAPISHDASGEWGWDATSHAILATGAGRRSATSGLSYEVSSLLSEPSPTDIAQARAGYPASSERTAEIPTDLPESIRQLAQQITADAETAGEKAIAIQRFLRDPGQFRYDTTAPGGAGYGVLERFLFEDRSGYCIHFATAMTAMSRVVGIPARVAVGFLPGTQRDDGSWAVSAHDMHAWPELYLDGLGWVAFEPTAAVSRQPGPGEPTPLPPTAPAPDSPSPVPPTPTPDGASSTQPSPTPGESPATPAPVPVAGPGGGLNLGWLGLAVALVAVLLTPGGLRALLRHRRLRGAAAGDTEAAWREVRATCIDTGLGWPGGSPRQCGALLASKAPEASREAARLALLVERSRYARTPGCDPSAAELAELLNSALLAATPRWRRIVAILLPRSLWQSRRTTLELRSPDTSQGGTDGPL